MKLIRGLVLCCFFFSCVGPLPCVQADGLALPSRQAGLPKLLTPTATFKPVLLKGLKVFPDMPFKMDFLMDQGQGKVSTEESQRLIKYFLAGLTIPNGDLWVNLSPYEKNRIIPESFGQTAMGVDVLSQDYILKQLTASLIYPESESGKLFWAKVYAQAQEKFGTTNIPVNTFNKVWIVPQEAVVYENKNVAYIAKAQLKVMLEEDYLAKEKNQLPTKGHVQDRTTKNVSPSTMPSELAMKVKATQGNPDSQAIGSQIIRDVIIPILEREVNEGSHFAQLRQVYHALILATWYKKKIKASLIAKAYVDQKKIGGLKDSVIASPEGAKQSDIEFIYQQYIQTFKKGVYNYIKEEPDPISGELIPRKYFSGGASLDTEPTTRIEERKEAPDDLVASEAMSVAHADLAMNSPDAPKQKNKVRMERIGFLENLSDQRHTIDNKGQALVFDIREYKDEIGLVGVARLSEFLQQVKFKLQALTMPSANDENFAAEKEKILAELKLIREWAQEEERALRVALPQFDNLPAGLRKGLANMVMELAGAYVQMKKSGLILTPIDLAEELPRYADPDSKIKVFVEVTPQLNTFLNNFYLESIISNLIVNARQALEEYKVENKAIHIKAFREGEKIKIEVADNGPGMTEEKMKDFNEGFEVSSSKEAGRKGEGTRFIRLRTIEMGGEVTVISQRKGPNHGTTFTISFPYFKAQEQDYRNTLTAEDGEKMDEKIMWQKHYIGTALQRLAFTKIDPSANKDLVDFLAAIKVMHEDLFSLIDVHATDFAVNLNNFLQYAWQVVAWFRPQADRLMSQTNVLDVQLQEYIRQQINTIEVQLVLMTQMNMLENIEARPIKLSDELKGLQALAINVKVAVQADDVLTIQSKGPLFRMLILNLMDQANQALGDSQETVGELNIGANLSGKDVRLEIEDKILQLTSAEVEAVNSDGEIEFGKENKRLPLFLIRKYTHALGGKVSVKSTTKGTIFTILLPASPAMNAVPTASAEGKIVGFEEIKAFIRSGAVKGKSFEIRFDNPSNPTLEIRGDIKVASEFDDIGRKASNLIDGFPGESMLATGVGLSNLKRLEVKAWQEHPVLIIGSGNHWLELKEFFTRVPGVKQIRVLEPDLSNILNGLDVVGGLTKSEVNKVVIYRGHIADLSDFSDKGSYGLIQSLMTLQFPIHESTELLAASVEIIKDALVDRGVVLSSFNDDLSLFGLTRLDEFGNVWQKDAAMNTSAQVGKRETFDSFEALESFLKSGEVNGKAFAMDFSGDKIALTITGIVPGSFDRNDIVSNNVSVIGYSDNKLIAEIILERLKSHGKDVWQDNPVMLIGPGNHWEELGVLLKGVPGQVITILEPNLMNIITGLKEIKKLPLEQQKRCFIQRKRLEDITEKNKYGLIYSYMVFGWGVIHEIDDIRKAVDALVDGGIIQGLIGIEDAKYISTLSSTVWELGDGRGDMYRKKRNAMTTNTSAPTAVPQRTPEPRDQLGRIGLNPLEERLQTKGEDAPLEFPANLDKASMATVASTASGQEAFSMEAFRAEVDAVARQGKTFEIKFNDQGNPELTVTGNMPNGEMFNETPLYGEESKKRRGFSENMKLRVELFLSMLESQEDEVWNSNRILLIGPGDHWREFEGFLEGVPNQNIDIMEPDLGNLFKGLRIISQLPLEERQRCLIRRMRAEDMKDQERYGLIYSSMVFSSDMDHAPGTHEKVERALKVGGILKGHSISYIPKGFEPFFKDKKHLGVEYLFKKVSSAMISDMPVVKVEAGADQLGGVDLNSIEDRLQTKGEDAPLEFPVNLDEAAMASMAARLTSLTPTITSIEGNITPAQFWLN